MVEAIGHKLRKVILAKKAIEFEDGWPVDENGKPMVKITFTASNTVPTAQYANVVVGPASATKFVPDTGQEDLSREIVELAKPVEWALGHERGRILKEISGEAEEA
jgi:hypothetical protein